MGVCVIVGGRQKGLSQAVSLETGTCRNLEHILNSSLVFKVVMLSKGPSQGTFYLTNSLIYSIISI